MAKELVRVWLEDFNAWTEELEEDKEKGKERLNRWRAEFSEVPGAHTFGDVHVCLCQVADGHCSLDTEQPLVLPLDVHGHDGMTSSRGPSGGSGDDFWDHCSLWQARDKTRVLITQPYRCKPNTYFVDHETRNDREFKHTAEAAARQFNVAHKFLPMCSWHYPGATNLVAFYQGVAAAESLRRLECGITVPRPQSTRSPIPPKLRWLVLQRDGRRCRYCGRDPETHGVVLHIDHVHPVSRGGKTEPSNLVTSCEDCNLGKGDSYSGGEGGPLYPPKSSLPRDR